jgi:hypothetical protein
MNRFGALLLLVLAAGCGGTASVPTTLQRYQAMSTDLDRITATTSSASRTMEVLRRDLRRSDERGTRRDAVQLKATGRGLANRAGSTAASIRAIMRRETNRFRVRYFNLILDALRYEWAEAQALRHVADLVWWDPFQIGAGGVSRLMRLSANAQWMAWQSVLSADAAQRWRAAHRSSFRYVPVREMSHVVAAP